MAYPDAECVATVWRHTATLNMTKL